MGEQKKTNIGHLPDDPRDEARLLADAVLTFLNTGASPRLEHET